MLSYIYALPYQLSNISFTSYHYINPPFVVFLWFFWSNLYKNGIMITFLIDFLELPNAAWTPKLKEGNFVFEFFTLKEESEQVNYDFEF